MSPSSRAVNPSARAQSRPLFEGLESRTLMSASLPLADTGFNAAKVSPQDFHFTMKSANPSPNSQDNRAPDLGVCGDLQVPAGHKVAAHAYAEGVQIYRWTGTAWAFVAPDAILYTKPGGGQLGTHYAGPTWESNSGGKVTATVDKRCTPDPDAIPWLLLKAATTDGPGPFHRVTYIQRVNTTGGTAPTDPGAFVGQVVEVPYTADYYFYRAHA